MEKIFFLIAIAALTQFSCSKKDVVCQTTSSLSGKWRMVAVKENTSGIIVTKPSSIQGNVDITFTATNTTEGTFFGVTPSNTISQNEYSTGTNQVLNIPVLGMTKVAETSWGKEFVNNIRNSREYDFENNGKLDIKTTDKTLIFQRL